MDLTAVKVNIHLSSTVRYGASEYQNNKTNQRQILRQDRQPIKMAEIALRDAVDKFNNLPKSVKQAIIGSSSGWLTGFTVIKFGRYAGFSMGASILLIQLGHHYGYININWKNVNRDLKKAKEEVEKQATNHMPDLSNRIKDCLKSNTIMASTFLGGFLLGASTA